MPSPAAWRMRLQEPCYIPLRATRKHTHDIVVPAQNIFRPPCMPNYLYRGKTFLVDPFFPIHSAVCLSLLARAHSLSPPPWPSVRTAACLPQESNTGRRRKVSVTIFSPVPSGTKRCVGCVLSDLRVSVVVVREVGFGGLARSECVCCSTIGGMHAIWTAVKALGSSGMRAPCMVYGYRL